MMPTPFCFDDDERDELRYHVEDLRDRYEEMQWAADELAEKIHEYNQQVELAKKFLKDKMEDCKDELYNCRTEKFQKTHRGQEIARWINQLETEVEKPHIVDLNVSEYIDSDMTNFADILEDLEKKA